MNKKTLFIVLVVILSFSFAFADENNGSVDLELTGIVSVNNRIHPVLNVDGNEYLLLVPRFFNIEEGDTITVKGEIVTDEYKENCPKFDENVTYLHVKVITINGKTYDIEKEFKNHRGGRGRKGNNGNGKDRGNGRGYGRNKGNCW